MAHAVCCDKYRPLHLVRRLNRYAIPGSDAKFWKYMELIGRISQEFFDDEEAFSMLSLQNVVLLATINTHYTDEPVLIRRIIKWCEVNCIRNGYTCRRFVSFLGMRKKLRWGTLNLNEIVFSFGFIFTRSEYKKLLKKLTDPSVHIDFLNLSMDNRGIGNMITNSNVVLSTAPFDFVQNFQYASSMPAAAHIFWMEITPRIYNYSSDRPWRKETVEVVVFFGTQTIQATMYLKRGSHTLFYLDQPISLFLQQHDVVSICLRFEKPGVFQLVDFECSGLPLVSCCGGIIQYIRGIAGFWM